MSADLPLVQHNTEGQPTVVITPSAIHVFGWVRVLRERDLDVFDDAEVIAAIAENADA